MIGKRYSTFPKAAALLGPKHQIVWYHIQDTDMVLPLWRDAVGVFYSRLGHRTLVGGVLPLCRNAVGVFYSSNRLGHRTLVGGVLPLCRDAVGIFYSPSRLGHRTLVGEVLPLCRDAVGVFYSSSRVGQFFFQSIFVSFFFFFFSMETLSNYSFFVSNIF